MSICTKPNCNCQALAEASEGGPVKKFRCMVDFELVHSETDTYPQSSDLIYIQTPLEKEVFALKEWKRNAIEVWPDMQAIGHELGIGLGKSVSANLLPSIKALKNENNEQKEAIKILTSRIAELEQQKTPNSQND